MLILQAIVIRQSKKTELLHIDGTHCFNAAPGKTMTAVGVAHKRLSAICEKTKHITEGKIILINLHYKSP